jgi:hypothetical protein
VSNLNENAQWSKKPICVGIWELVTGLGHVYWSDECINSFVIQNKSQTTVKMSCHFICIRILKLLHKNCYTKYFIRIRAILRGEVSIDVKLASQDGGRVN